VVTLLGFAQLAVAGGAILAVSILRRTLKPTEAEVEPEGPPAGGVGLGTDGHAEPDTAPDRGM
jgi:hypothetical protein